MTLSDNALAAIAKGKTAKFIADIYGLSRREVVREAQAAGYQHDPTSDSFRATAAARPPPHRQPHRLHHPLPPDGTRLMSLSTEATTNLAARLVAIADAKAELDAEADGIKAVLRTLDPGTHQAGPYKVTVSVQRRFDPTLAQQILDEATYTSLCTAFDSKKAKATLPPALYDTLMTESGEPRIVVK